MNKLWQDERKEIAVWLSGYLSMVKKWVDKILDNEDHDINKNKIISTIDELIKYLQDTKMKIMKMRDNPITETNKYGDDDWATPPHDK